MASVPTPEGLTSERLVVFVADLSGYHRGFRSHTDEEMARFLHRYYALAQATVDDAGGTIVKFIGDAVLAVFPQELAPRAVGAAVALETACDVLAAEVGLDMKLGANLHFGPVVTGRLGSGASRREDVIGRTVNQTFLLGRGRGIRVSERVYRLLPSGERGPWQKNKPPAVYVLGDADEVYASLRKSAAENALRW